MECEVLITQDEAWRRGSTIAAQDGRRRGDGRRAGHEALRRPPPHRQRRRDAGGPRPLVARPRERCSDDPRPCPCEPMDSEDLLFLMYTSGTTAKPKGIVHTTAGYLAGVAATHHYIFDLKPDDGRLLVRRRHRLDHRPQLHRLRAALQRPTSVLYEGTPDFPDKDRWWSIVEQYGVTILYTAPTAIRSHMKWGPEHAQQHDLSSLRLLGSVGEPINPGGVGLVPRAHRRRPHADRRHVVADRDGHGPDHAAAGSHDAEARLGDAAVPGRRRRRCTTRRATRSGPAAAAISSSSARGRRCCAASSATTQRYRDDVLVEVRGRRTSRATARGSTGTATSGCSAASTT